MSYLAHSGETRYLLKKVTRLFADTFKQSAEVVRFLNECGFPAPKIILTDDNLPYCQNGGDWLILFEFIDGADVDNDGEPEQIGELIGKLHPTMRDYSAPLSKRGKEYFIDRYIRLLEKNGISDKTLIALDEYGGELWARIGKLPRGFSHGDCHAGNLLRADKLYLLDFDTSAMAFPAYDWAVMCDSTNYFSFEKNDVLKSKEILSRFFDGYSKYATPSEFEISSYFDLIAVRHYQLQPIMFELYPGEVNPGFIDGQFDWLTLLRDAARM